MSRRRLCAVLLLAAPLAPLEPAGADTQLVGLGEQNVLLRFTAERPGEAERIGVTGASAPILGIDFRPADGVLYGVSSANDLYAIDVASGTARLVSTLTQGFDGSPRSAFDFNPQADRLRLIASTGQDLRVHVALGAVAVDGPLAYAAGDANAGKRPRVTAAAYTHNVPAAPTTQLFDIDFELDVLALQDPPNDGSLRTVGPLGVDFGPTGGFDIRSGPGGVEQAFAASGATLYEIDLASGAARALGAIGDGQVSVIGLAVRP
jgi:hypothetical protein